MANDTPVDSVERRAATRQPIERRVVFSGVRGEGLLRQGMAMDVSASGLLIHTAQPDLPGRHLEIELHPGADVSSGDVILVRAEVAWVRPLPGNAGHAMGVRFLQSVPATDATGAHYQPADKAESARMAESIRRTLESMEPAVRLDLSDRAVRKNRESREQPRERRRTRTLVWLFMLFLFSLLVCLLTLGLLWKMGIPPRRITPVQSENPRGTDAPVPRTTGPTAPESTPDDVVGKRIEQIAEAGPAYHLIRGSFWLAQGRYPAAAQAFQVVRRLPESTPVERFVADLGEAEALARDNNVPAALALLESPFPELDAIPESWRALKEQFRDALLAAPGTDSARMPMRNAFHIELVAGEATDADAADTSAIRIEIDTTHYLLNVLQDNSLQAVYPIGLGARNRTPEGEYRIVNKIENPDWYNNGDVIPAGDPENELGSRWLGLGDEEGPTQIGIHATDDLDSIGGNESRGCIRMRPEDVEDLFERVAVGTPVFIRAL